MTALSPIAAVAHDAATRPEQARRWAVNQRAWAEHAALSDYAVTSEAAAWDLHDTTTGSHAARLARFLDVVTAARWDAVEALGGER